MLTSRVSSKTVQTEIRKATYRTDMSCRCCSSTTMDVHMDLKMGGAVEGAPTVGTHMPLYRVMSR
jgi:hypothetical protein